MTLRKKEAKAWDNFSRHSDPRKLKKIRIESNIDSFPDVIIQNRRGAVFLVENKALIAWPKRETTFPLKNAFQPGQLSFLREWEQWGGRSCVLLHVGSGPDREILYLNVFQPLESMTTIEIQDNAVLMRGYNEIIAYMESASK